MRSIDTELIACRSQLIANAERVRDQEFSKPGLTTGRYLGDRAHSRDSDSGPIKRATACHRGGLIA
jgi:hypothetical protein